MRKLKKVNPIVWVVVIVALVICLLTSAFLFLRTKKQLEIQSMTDTSALQGQLNSLMQTVYVAATDIKMGELITETNVVSQTIMSDRDPSLMMTYEDIGKIATVDIAMGAPVYKTNVSDIMKKDLTERECNFIYLNGNIAENDYIDVRIMFPTGEDMVVVAKTPIKTPIASLNSCYLWLSETQNDLLSAAIVDASLNDARLYINKYVQPAVENPSVVTYQPNQKVIDLMQTNPMVITASEESLVKEVSLNKGAREILDNNLRDFFEEHAEDGYKINYEITEGAEDSAAAAGGLSNVGDTGAAQTDPNATPVDPNVTQADPNVTQADPNAAPAE